ncbi:hypothetical protein Micbo1qcDRAFT_156889, partial [Microdochium bolleyi]
MAYSRATFVIDIDSLFFFFPHLFSIDHFHSSFPPSDASHFQHFYGGYRLLSYTTRNPSRPSAVGGCCGVGVGVGIGAGYWLWAVMPIPGAS